MLCDVPLPQNSDATFITLKSTQWKRSTSKDRGMILFKFKYRKIKSDFLATF